MPKHRKILAVDPGTRYMGIAYLEGKKALYHGVKVIPTKKNPHDTLREGRKIILRLIRDLKPQVLAVEKTFFAHNRNSALLNVFIKEILAVGKRKGLKVVAYAPSTVKKHITGNGWANKKEVARVIVSGYPDLKVYLNQDRGWKERYHQNMFDAVAVGLVAMDDKKRGW
jgi:crossover junction endodeoxyribonuclease RuvC